MLERNKPIEYFVHCYADHLPKVDKPGLFGKENHLDANEGCDPFVRITMDSKGVCSEPLCDQRRRVFWPDPLRVKTKTRLHTSEG